VFSLVLLNLDLANLEMSYNISVAVWDICVLKGSPDHGFKNPIVIEICGGYGETKAGDCRRHRARHSAGLCSAGAAKDINFSGIAQIVYRLIRGPNHNIRRPIPCDIRCQGYRRAEPDK